MAGLIAISIEKYATMPEMGRAAYEKGLDEGGSIAILSPRRFKFAKSDELQIRKFREGHRAIGIRPGLHRANICRFYQGNAFNLPAIWTKEQRADAALAEMASVFRDVKID